MLKKMEAIRRLTTDYNNKFSMSKDGNSWNKLCSSLDVVEDTELAIKSYISHKEPKDEGLKYLHLYGLLQALYVQQIALNGICESFGLSCILNEFCLKQIRSERNDSIGHPTNRSTGVYHYIVRVSIRKKGYDLLSFDRNNKMIHRSISVFKLITDQRKIVKSILFKVQKKLIEDLKKADKNGIKFSSI